MSYNTYTGYNVFEEVNTPFQLSPILVNSSSTALSPTITYNSVFNLSPFVVNSVSEALRPTLSFGNSQRIGTVTASFSGDLYTARFAD